MTKRAFCLFTIMIFCFLSSRSVFAGSVPEDLLQNDGARIFFAEVTAYHPDRETPDIEITPVNTVKGDVKSGKQTYSNPVPIGNIKPTIGAVYLFAYDNEHNPTYIFGTSGYETKTLKLTGIDGLDMWNRFQEYLNNGDFEAAEALRQKKNPGAEQTAPANRRQNHIKPTIVIVIAAAVILTAVIIKRRRQNIR